MSRGTAGAVVVCMILAISACSPEATETPQGTGAGGSLAPATEPADTEVTELVVGWGSVGPGEWAPARTGGPMQESTKPLFSTLTRINHETYEYEGLLAESYSLSDDGQTWTFVLRPDIPFHDDWGTVTADDVKFTWGEWISEESNHAVAATLGRAIDDDLDNFEVVSDLEFRLHSTQPVVNLDVILGDQGNGLQVVPRRYHEEMGAEAEAHPIGTGPWKFVSATPGVEVVMEAVDDHFVQTPAFDRLIIREIPDAAARLTQVQSGAVDMAFLDPALVGEAQQAGLDVRSVPDVANVFGVFGGSYWGSDFLDDQAPWIQSDNPVQGRAIREAMSLAIDRQLIIDNVLGGQASLTSGPLIQSDANPLLLEPSWEHPTYDLDLARQRLVDGGYPDGFPVTIVLYDRAPNLPGVSEAIAGMWEELGLTVTREPMDEGVLDGLMDDRNTAGKFWLRAAGLKGEPSQQLTNYRSSAERSNGFYHLSIDEGHDLMIAEPDATQRYEYARDVIASLREDSIALTMFTAGFPFVAGPRIGEWDPVPVLDEMSGLETITLGN